MKVISQKYLMLPLYLYDHSGITMNTTGFSCPWDSGQVGWIYASKENALREFGGKSFTAATRKKAEDCMRGEVECYDSYLRGELTVLNCIKTASWRIAAGALSAVTRKP